MVRTYNIGTECYALMTTTNDADFLLPVKIVILEKKTFNNKTTYKVKIKDILEKDFKYVKEHLYGIRVLTSFKSDGRTTLIKKSKLDPIENFGDLLVYLDTIKFYIEDNYITLDKEGLKDLYNRFTKYLVNFHYRKLYQLMSRTFVSNSPIYENQKDVFKKRVEKIGFGDMFEKFGIKLSI